MSDAPDTSSARNKIDISPQKIGFNIDGTSNAHVLFTGDDTLLQLFDRPVIVFEAQFYRFNDETQTPAVGFDKKVAGE